MKTIAYVANAKSGGVSIFELRRDGSLAEIGACLTDKGVAPLAVSPDRRYMYAAVRNGPAVAALALDADSGELEPLNAVPVPDTLHYLTVDAAGRFLLGASYGGDFIIVLPLGREGMVQPEPVCTLRPGRNPHCIVLDASNRFAYAPVLGSDIVAQYRFDDATGMLAPLAPAFVAAERQAGPRHAALSPDNRFLHLLTEMGGDVVTFAINHDNGCLSPLHSVPVLPPEQGLPKGTYTPPANANAGANSPSPVMWTAEIRVTPDNRFLYASERTNSTISLFRVDSVSGRLDLTDVFETEKQPRGFCVDPFGKHLLAAGELSDHVAVYAIDPESGALTLVDRKAVGDGPTWVETVRL